MRLPLIVALAVAGTACKGTDDKPPPRTTRSPDATAFVTPADAAPLITAGTATTAEAVELCQRFFGAALAAIPKKCSEADLRYRPIPDHTIQMGIDSCLEIVGGAAAAGRISFGPKRLACIEAQEQLARRPGRDHDHVWDPRELPACVGLISGTQPLGAPCAATIECADGLACGEGRCVAPAALGAACPSGILLDVFGVHTECLAGATCDGLVCRMVDPVRRWKHGYACGPEFPGLCPDDSYCDETKQRCTKRKRAGSKCKEGFECRGECGAEYECMDLCGSG